MIWHVTKDRLLDEIVLRFGPAALVAWDRDGVKLPEAEEYMVSVWDDRPIAMWWDSDNIGKRNDGIGAVCIRHSNVFTTSRVMDGYLFRAVLHKWYSDLLGVRWYF